MKPSIAAAATIALLTLALCGCEPGTEPAKPLPVEASKLVAPITAEATLTNSPSTRPSFRYQKEDFVMSDLGAVSNATFFAKPPDDFYVVCDDTEHYAVVRGSDMNLYDIPSCDMVRTNRFEAIVAAWKIKSILEGQHPAPHTTNLWKLCDK